MKLSLAGLLLLVSAADCRGLDTQARSISNPPASISLVPSSSIFDLEKVSQGAVRFTASVRNKTSETITMGYPSICFPSDYKQGDTRQSRSSRGKSKILLKVTQPDGTHVLLRDGFLHFFDPGNRPLLTIPPHETATFRLGWFFLNARGGMGKC
jgi:hypothetical protein